MRRVKATAVRGRELCELRRSNAAGLHVKRGKDRANTRRRAIAYSRDNLERRVTR